jgi:outer membrane protein TolC
MRSTQHRVRSVLAGLSLSFSLAAVADSSTSPLPQQLKLQELTQRVLRQNQQILLQQLECRVSETQIKAEEGIFEPVLVFNGSYKDGDRPTTAEEQTSQANQVYLNKDSLLNSSISGLLATGAQYNLGISASRLRNNSVSQISLLSGTTASYDLINEDYVTFAGIELTQPLLRGFGIDITRLPIRLALIDSDIRLYELRKKVAETITQTESAYWDLKLAYEQVRIRQDSIEIANKLLTDNRERMKAGKGTELDVYQAETGLMLREAQLSEAQQKLREVVSGMYTLLSLHAEKQADTLIPVDAPKLGTAPLVYEQSFETSLQFQPDYLIRKSELEKESLRLKLARNELKPKLDVSMSYGFNGLGDTPQDAWIDIRDSDFDTWSVGLRLEMPLGGNRKASNQLAAAKIRNLQQESKLSDMGTQLANTLTMLIGRLNNLSQRLDSLHKVVEFNQRLLNVSMERLAAGQGEIRQVLQMEEDLSKAKNSEMESLIDYQKTYLHFESVEGKLLQTRGVDVIKLYL